MVDVLKKFALVEHRLSDLSEQYLSLEMWHETNSQKDETIQRNTQFSSSTQELILSGPHLFVGNPFNKTPRTICKLKSDYDILDLTILPGRDRNLM